MIKCWKGWLLLRPLSLPERWPSYIYAFTSFFFSLCFCAQNYSSIRTLVSLDEGLCCWPHYNLITSVCTYDHIWGTVLGLHHIRFWGHNLFHNTLLHNNITTNLVAQSNTFFVVQFLWIRNLSIIQLGLLQDYNQRYHSGLWFHFKALLGGSASKLT